MAVHKDERTREEILEELAELRAKHAEAEETLRAIREGEVDAIVVSGNHGEQVFSLSGSEHVYRLIVETMSEAALTVSFEGRVLFCNRQFTRMLRLPPERILGSFFEELVPVDERGEAVLLLERARLGTFTCRMVFKPSGAPALPVHLSATVLSTTEGESICIVATDLSELESSNQLIRKLHSQQISLRESEQRWATTLASIGDAVIATDPGGIITFMNPVAESLTGWSGSEAAGKNITDIMLIIDRHTRLPEVDTVDIGITGTLTRRSPDHTLLVHRDGTEVSITINRAPIRTDDGKIKGTVIVFHDTTLQRRTEESLRLATAQAESANRAKSEFLANMSHDIRTPLSGILGIIDLLSLQLQGREQQEYLSLMKGSARSLLSLIGDILDLSRIESGRDELVPETFDPYLEFERLEKLFMLQAREKSLTLAFQMDPGVPEVLKGDREKFSRVLRNLVSNAVKYSDRGEIRVQALTRSMNDGKLILECSVSDNGIGIPARKLEFIFQSFTRLSASTQAGTQEGTGLGLAICRRLVTLMGGDITVESEEGLGSTFSFRIPMETGSTEEKPPIHAEVQPGKLSELPHLRILLAEDNRINQIFLKSILIQAGHEVVIAGNGSEAVDLIVRMNGSGQFDLILMDVQMPGMDGLEATQVIRSTGGPASKIPIIALTAFAMKEDEERFRETGMNGYVTKPVDWNELTRVIQMVLKK